MDKPLSLVEHLEELRRRIIIVLISLIIGVILSFPLASFALGLLKLPSSGIIEKLVFFSPSEAFVIYMNISLFLGCFISMPVILYQFWAFILPALEEKQKRYIGFFSVFCLISFILGSLFAYFVLLAPALKFLLSFAKGELEPVISASKYISFVVGLILGCGLVFQMPVLSFLLSRLGMINGALLRKKYKYAVLIIFIIAAVITPTSDIFNLLILALPMLFLYEISIWIAFLAKPK